MLKYLLELRVLKLIVKSAIDILRKRVFHLLSLKHLTLLLSN